MGFFTGCCNLECRFRDSGNFYSGNLLLWISFHGYVKGNLWVLGYNMLYANIGVGPFNLNLLIYLIYVLF